MKPTAHERHEIDQHLAGESAIVKARQLLPSFRAAMLVTRGAEAGQLHMRPMALQGDLSTFGGTLWFFTDDRSEKVREIEHDSRVHLVFQNDQDSRYLQLTGSASTVTDRAKMRELYTPTIRTWFPSGLDDPHLMLIRIDVTSGTFWETPGGIVHVLAAFTKAVVTGTPSTSGHAGTMDL